MDVFDNSIPFPSEFDDGHLGDLFGETSAYPALDNPADSLVDNPPQSYQAKYGVQYGQPMPQTQYERDVYDYQQRQLQHQSFPAEQQQQQQQPYQDPYGQRFDSAYPGGEDQVPQLAYDNPYADQQDFTPGFYGQQQYPPPPGPQDAYGQQTFPTYQTPAGQAVAQKTPMKAPKKAPKKRASKKTPVKSGEDDFKVSKKAPKKKASKKASKKNLRGLTPDTEDDDDIYPANNRASRKAPKKSMREPTPEPESEDEIVPVSYRAFKNSNSPKQTVKEPSPAYQEEGAEIQNGVEVEVAIEEADSEEEADDINIDPRIARKAPKKTIKTPLADPNDPTDYTPITSLIASSTAASSIKKKDYFPFLKDHLDFVILRFATVCVALCRMDKEHEAGILGQFAVDFFGQELWVIAIEHYMQISLDGDDELMMKACMADCIGSFKLYTEEVAGVLQEAVSFHLADIGVLECDFC